MARGYTYVGDVSMVTVECCAQGCSVIFGITADLHRRRSNDHGTFYCPNGHGQHFTGTSDAERLRDEQARNTHLKDQLTAAAVEAEMVRKALVRDRHRFANGVCPCCNRYFDNVRRHMTGQHPEYDIAKISPQRETSYACSCGRGFSTPRGLAVHQGHSRSADWAIKGKEQWHGGHLTAVDA